MELFEAIKNRRSIRKYKPEPLSKETLQKICEAGNFAATANNKCPWHFTVITDRKRLDALELLTEKPTKNAIFLKQATAAIIVTSQEVKYYLEDGSAATQNMLLAAHGLGVGTCWVAGDKKDYCPDVLAFIGAPAGEKLVSIISCGIPDEKPVKNKPELNEILKWDRF